MHHAATYSDPSEVPTPPVQDNAGLWVLGAVIILVAVCAVAPAAVYAAIRRWV
jgi:hypothetical protein